MEKGNNKQQILRHAKRLRFLILTYSVVFIVHLILMVFPEFREQLFSGTMSSLYVTLAGLPITAYAIWYVLNRAPMRQLSKTNKVLGLLFLGVIGMWMTYPLLNGIEKKLERDNSGVRFSS